MLDAVVAVVAAVVPCVVMQQAVAVAVLVYTACHYLTPAPHL